ncbi:MAG: asparagine synthase-related protein [Mucinivorans sp.]
MFIGNFTNEPITSQDTFYYKPWNGLMIGNDAICYQTPEVAIAFWGKIYNTENLGVEPIASDAQTLEAIFRLQDLESFRSLDGSFTFILKTADYILIMRDAHGTGPQVYYTSTHFASDLNELINTPHNQAKVNKHALGSFLEMGYIPTPDSALEGISKLQAGSMLIYTHGQIRLFNAYDGLYQKEQGHLELNLSSASEQYGLLHRQAILRRIGKSRNVGILLSGGYDSGANLAALRQVYDGKISSYSVGFKGNQWSELPLAQCMSDRFGTDHHTYEIDGTEILNLPRIIDWFGDPFVEGGLMVNYAAMNMVANDPCDVVLGGDGSDQYFGTAAREIAINRLMSKYKLTPLMTTIHQALSHSAFDKDNLAYRVRFQLSKIINILQSDRFGFEPFMLKELLLDPEQSMPPKLDNEAFRPSKHHSFDDIYNEHNIDTDIKQTIDQVILFKASKMAAMFKTNLAFPFMDIDLCKFLHQLPEKYKYSGESLLSIAKGQSTSKFLLKYHYKPLLPTEITNKKKQGGFAPMSIFFEDKTQRDYIANLITESYVLDEFLNRKKVEQFLRTYDKEASDKGQWFWYKQNKAIQYFNLLTLTIWWNTHMEGGSKKPHYTL